MKDQRAPATAQHEPEDLGCKTCGSYLILEVDERGFKAYVCRKCHTRDECAGWRTRVTIRHPATPRLLVKRSRGGLVRS